MTNKSKRKNLKEREKKFEDKDKNFTIAAHE